MLHIVRTVAGLQLGRAEVLRGLRNFLNMDGPEHHLLKDLTVVLCYNCYWTSQRHE